MNNTLDALREKYELIVDGEFIFWDEARRYITKYHNKSLVEFFATHKAYFENEHIIGFYEFH